MPNDGSPERRPYGPVDAEFTAAQVFDPVAFAKRLEAARAQREEALARRRARANAAQPDAGAQTSDAFSDAPSAPSTPSSSPQAPFAAAAPHDPSRAAPQPRAPRDAASDLRSLAAVDAAPPSPRRPPQAAADAARPSPLRRPKPPAEPLVAPPRRIAPRRKDAPRYLGTLAATLLALGAAGALTLSPELRDGARRLIAGAQDGDLARGLEAFAVDLAPSPPAPTRDAAGPPVAWATASAPGFQPAVRTAIPHVPAAAPPEAAAPVAPALTRGIPPRLARVGPPPATDAPAAPPAPAAARVAALDPPPAPALPPAVTATTAIVPARPPAVEPHPAPEPEPATAVALPPEPSAPAATARTDFPAPPFDQAATPDAPAVAPAPPGAIPDAAPPGAIPDAAPSGAISIAVHAPPSLSDAALGNAIAAVGSSGFGSVRGVRVGFAIGQTHVRYFHDADQDDARRLASALGDGAGVRDFTFFTPPPALGRLEVWLSGGDVRRAAAPARAAPAAPLRPAAAAAPAARTITATPLAPPPAFAAGQAPAAQRVPASAQAAPGARPGPAFAVGRRPLEALAPPPPTSAQPGLQRLLGQVGIGIPAHDRIRR